MCGRRSRGDCRRCPVLMAHTVVAQLWQSCDTAQLTVALCGSCNSARAVRNQGACGGCWAFAGAEALADRLCVGAAGARFQNLSLSPEYFMDCDALNAACGGGLIDDAWKFLATRGLAAEQVMAYSCNPYGESYCSCKPTRVRSRCSATRTSTAHTQSARLARRAFTRSVSPRTRWLAPPAATGRASRCHCTGRRTPTRWRRRRMCRACRRRSWSVVILHHEYPAPSPPPILWLRAAAWAVTGSWLDHDHGRLMARSKSASKCLRYVVILLHDYPAPAPHFVVAGSRPLGGAAV